MSIFRDNPGVYDVFRQVHAQETPPERVAWEFMIRHQEENHGIPPTLAEIAEVLPHKHRSSAKHLVEKLLTAGWVEEVAEEGKSRRYLAVNAPTKGYEAPDDIFTRIVPRVDVS